jgi:zinc-binding alcohol dehydrogenase/oxidoreductase
VKYAPTVDWPGAVRELGRVDLVLDSVGSTWPQSLECVRRGGRVVVFGATGGTDVELQVRPLYFGQQSLLGTQLGSPRDFESLLRLLGIAAWRPVIDSVKPLAEVEAALARMEASEHFGKLVLAIA